MLTFLTIAKKKSIATWTECRDLCNANDECEYFSDDSLLSHVKSSTFTSVGTGDCKKYITPTESFERTLENDDFNDEEISFDAGEGDVVFVTSVNVSQKHYLFENAANDDDNEDEKFHDTKSNSGSNNSIEVGMEIAEDQDANKSNICDKNEDIANDSSKGIIEHNDEDVAYVEVTNENANKNVSKGSNITRGKGKRKGKKK